MIKNEVLLRSLAPLAVLATTAFASGVLAGATGLAYGLALVLLTDWGLRRSGRGAFGPADWITFARAVLVGCAAELVAAGGHPLWWLVGIVAVALAMDGFDGQVARRTGTASEFGARFDMEVDAFLILVLCIQVSRTLGLWVLAIGLMRYAFVAASWALPWLTAPLYPSMARKTVAAVQGVVLVVAVSGVLPAVLAFTAVALALTSLVWSFGRDTVWLARHRTPVAPARIVEITRTPVKRPAFRPSHNQAA
ncbi:CDP-alcohol phosphatidyltransferase family protein [Amycolatopsis sp. OK19-0408]|uniref:CDP-alcohol phosphatidyltransferase family protein n=1 Tax=Amycolatopsis iheyensis TaxID=2945988 RepID=A0A9X2SIU9_9PSEU|nr:CDP-alcohol phosphatidyltransferase family protein [Amycolatopsis iheyensis]MCR6484117.1 CDP-alcohol phosphatidyltransferase family protein [Amycolatopsis iheyensis]